MFYTIKTNVVFKNKYIELQNNIVENIEEKQFEHIKLIENSDIKPGVVVICENAGKLLLLKNYRYGIDKEVWEFPRGYKECNEALKECAIRELMEETGVKNNDITQIHKIGEMNVNSAFMASTVEIYFIKINTFIIQPQDNENISEYLWVSFLEIKNLIRNHQITDSFTLSALMQFSLVTDID